jgi:hypothetical protein
MIPIPPAVLAALETEALSILTRLAESPGLKHIEAQFAERLAHLAERLGEEVFGKLRNRVAADLAAKKAQPAQNPAAEAIVAKPPAS